MAASPAAAGVAVDVDDAETYRGDDRSVHATTMITNMPKKPSTRRHSR